MDSKHGQQITDSAFGATLGNYKLATSNWQLQIGNYKLATTNWRPAPTDR